MVRPAPVLVLLLLAALSLRAVSLPVGPWHLETDLNESEARALVSQLSFQPDAIVPDAWTVTSDGLLLSEPDGLSPRITLWTACPAGAPNCTTSTDLYRASGEAMQRVGRLRPKDSPLFRPPSSSASSGHEPAPPINESDTPLASIDAPVGVPLEWLWALALGLVLLITLTFLARNRD